MEPIRLIMHNFTSYRDETVQFDGVSCAALTGENGSGKSSLLDAITWILFGLGTRGKDLDNYVTRGESECLVELHFRLNGNLYRVVRGRSRQRSKSTLEFFVQDGPDWRPLSAKAITDTQLIIEQTLRMDYRTFTASSLILQGQADSFTANLTDAERKEVLARILGLDLWAQLQERAKEKARSASAALQAYDLQANRLQESIDRGAGLSTRQAEITAELSDTEKGIEALADCMTDLEVRLRQRPTLEKDLAEARQAMDKVTDERRRNDARREQITAQTNQCKGQVATAQKVLEHRDEIEAAVALQADIAADVAEFGAKALELTRCTEELAKVERQKAAWESNHNAKVAGLEAEVQALKRQAEVMDQVPCEGGTRERCPLLARAHEAQKKAATLETVELPILRNTENPHTAAYEAAKAKKDNITYDPDAHQAARDTLAEVQKTAALKPALDAAGQRVSELNTRITELQQESSSLESREKELVDQLLTLAEKDRSTQAELESLTPLVAEFDTKRRRLGELRQREAELRTELGRVDQQLAAVHTAEKEKAQIAEDTMDLRRRLTVLETLDQACGKKAGVPALIVENAVPELERLANEMLSRMAGGRLQVRLDTQAEAKTTGNIQEVLRIIVLDGGNERPYQTYSGAERFMVDLALRVALSKFLCHRAGAEIQLFALDEGIGCADDVNRQAILDAILTVASEFRKTLVITHLNELKDAFPQRLDVQKTDDGGSKVRVA